MFARATFSNAAYNVSPSAVNGLNQYTSAGSAAFGYDPNGNLASTVNAPWSTTYVYDVENRLVSASGSHDAELSYDPLGRLWQVSSGGAVRRLVYDGDALIAEYDGAGAMPHRYLHGNDSGADDPLLWWHNAVEGWRRFLLTDHQGSVIGTTDMYGNSIAANSYDPWGVPGPDNIGMFGYTGQTWVPELGLWYYKARFYSPTTGRFLQVDPVGYKDQMNLYAYVGNDPVNRLDPTGKRMVVSGSKDDREEFKRLMFRSTGHKISIGKNGVVSLFGARDNKIGNVGTANALTNAISAKGTVSFNLVRDDVTSFGDSFVNGNIDLGDFAKFSQKSEQFSGALLNHVITERTTALTNGGKFDPSHDAALISESKVMGAAYRDNKGTAVDAFLQNGTIKFNYTDSAGKVISSYTFGIKDGIVEP